jgi:LAO/AO transport system kinase
LKSISNTTTALNVKAGIKSPEIVSDFVVQKIKNFRRNKLEVSELIAGILKNDISCLSQAITLIESTNPDHLSAANKIITACLPKANNSIRIGITGIPGVGKSTFIESFGKYLTGLGKKVAVLAIDPSSSISNGSILGDKTRMEDLVNDPNAFIRPSAAGGILGGVARKTRESITLCEAAGFDIILIETVGVGQSETSVHSMVDFFLLLKISGAGDELQGIKRGIIEMADAIIINKADGDNINRANLAKTEFNRALHLFPAKKSGWSPVVSTCSAVEKEGIDTFWNIISDYLLIIKANGFFETNRNEQNQFWMFETINEQLKNNFYNNKEIDYLIEKYKLAIKNLEKSPFSAAQELLKIYKQLT